jgi:hypothetical protein
VGYLVNIRINPDAKRDPKYVYIGRGSKWGNPYSHIPGSKGILVRDRAEAIERYREHLHSSGLIDDIKELENKILGCFCLPAPCHGEVLLELVTEFQEYGYILARCPHDGEPCDHDRDWGHPCDRDETGEYECLRLKNRPGDTTADSG